MTIASETLDLLSSMLEPTPLTILLSVLLVVTLPILLHLLLNRDTTSHTLPTILLLGPPDAGKTSLLTLFETGTAKSTVPSQSPLAVECSLPLHTATASSQYRSPADPANTNTHHIKFLLTDTPGHAKLRHHALSALSTSSPDRSNLKGIIFLLDSSALSPGSESLRQTAEYLHDILLLLQKQAETKAKKSTTKKGKMRVLVAANKADIFTALPAPLVRKMLEQEIGLVRESLRVGLLGSGVEEGEAEEKGWLGGGEGEFRFEQLDDEGEGVEVEVRGGSVLGGGEVKGGEGKEGGDVGEWWGWVGECL